MKLIFCVEKNNGIMFFGKRQTKDRLLNKHLLEIIGDSKLWVSSYSAELFEEAENVTIDDNYIEKAYVNDYCFVEDKGFNLDATNEIILCNWNREYPADKFFEIDLSNNCFKKESTENIVGSSHKKITIERYVRG